MTEEYTTVGEVSEHLLEFNEARDGIEFSQTTYFVPAETDSCMEYLHRDGEIRTGTSAGHAFSRLLQGGDHKFKKEQDIWDMYTGFFPTREEAVAARETYNGTAHYK